MLVVRNLLLGPKRFKDLADGLPGIGTGLLSQRLKELETAGLITKATLPPPAGSAVYELTKDGQSLRPVLLGLARWGMTRLGEPSPGQHIDAETLALAVAARFNPASAHGVDGTYALKIDERPFRLDVTAHSAHVTAGQPDQPRVSIAMTTPTLLALNNGTRNMADALADQSVTVHGDMDTILPLARAFGFTPS